MVDNAEVAAMAARDAALAERIPPPSKPEGYEDFEFQKPELPSEPFMLERLDDGEKLGPFQPDEWFTDPDSNITTTHDSDGKVFMLRVAWQDQKPSVLGNPGLLMLGHVEDDGNKVTYLVKIIRDNMLDEPELPAAAPTNEEDPWI